MTREDQIKKAGEIIAYGCSDELKEALIKDFPELESEDERIRKSLLAYIKGESKRLDTQKWIAYLEKQKGKGLSDDDEKKIYFLSRLIEFHIKDDEYCFGDGTMITKQGAIDMLNSLRSKLKVDSVEYERGFLAGQSSIQHWKPSKEQMEAFEESLMSVAYTENKIILESLLEQLKKL